MGILVGTSEHHGILHLRKVNLGGHAKGLRGEIVRSLDPSKIPVAHDQVVPCTRRLAH